MTQPLRVTAIPAFADNYLWLVHDQRHAVVVDPGDAAPVLHALAAGNLVLGAILLTHHHPDHAGGVADLLAHAGKVPVYGPARERIAGVDHPLHGGNVVTIPSLGLRLLVIDVPGHTAGHVAYYDEAGGRLFCGDTLFAAGCGRVFEGTPAQMTESLAKLAALPDSTQMYCAHEYTVANLRFAHAADPDNADVTARLEREQAKRARGEATLPSTIGLEKATNPFLRCTTQGILASLRKHRGLRHDDAVAAFSALREWKNNFR